jgi:site-specific DNA-cytosine methylase
VLVPSRAGYDVWQADIAKLDSKTILDRHKGPKEVFLMVGGPPCQSFCPGGMPPTFAPVRQIIQQF